MQASNFGRMLLAVLDTVPESCRADILGLRHANAGDGPHGETRVPMTEGEEDRRMARGAADHGKGVRRRRPVSAPRHAAF